MVRYLKLIVIVFGSIGLLIGSFFFLQNKHDILRAFEYNKKIDYTYLKTNCKSVENNYYYPCLKEIFREYLSDVSFTGANIGLKMVFSVMDDDKDNVQNFPNQKNKDFVYSINYLEINNMVLDNAYRKYFGFSFLYGGFIATLKENYSRGFTFSENIILGLQGPKGIKQINDEAKRLKLLRRLEKVKKEFYKIKFEVESFIEKEMKKILKQHK